MVLFLAIGLLSGCAGMKRAEQAKAQFGTYYNAAITPAANDILLIADASNTNKVEGIHAEDLPIGTATQTALDGKVGDTGDETIAGVKTFSSFPVSPSSAPTTDYQMANKKYVDDNGGTGGDQLVDIVTTTPLLINGGANLDDALPGADGDITFSLPAATKSTAGHMTALQAALLEDGLITNFNGTAYRVFYVNAGGDVTEVALGADGTYLRSNGSAAAPTFTTPSGAGDILSVLDDTTGDVPELIQIATAFSANDSTPDVSGHSFFITANTSATTITNFDNPANGKVFWLLVNDEYTTFDFTSSGLVGISDDYLALNGELVCFYYSSVTSNWHFLGFPKNFSLNIGGFAANRAIYSDDDGVLEVSDVTQAELELLDGALNVQSKSMAVADLADTSTPSVLTAAETADTKISNYKSTGADHVFTMPAPHVSGGVIFTIGDEFQVDIEPNTDDLFYLNGTAMAANEHIQNTADTLGQRIVGYCMNINGTLRWMFYSSDTAWVEETP